MNYQLLARSSLFSGLPENELVTLAEIAEECRYPQGEVLFREGQRSDRLALLLEGEVEIVKSLGDGDERSLGRRGPGTVLGEMSLFSPSHTATASVRAQTALRVLEMKHAPFEGLLHDHPTLSYSLLETLSRRLEEAENNTIADLRAKNRQLSQAYAELQAAEAQLIEKEKLERELEIASTLQQSILPQQVPQIAGYDFGALMVPAHAIGGDFYDFIPLGADRLGIVVGDVCSKGIPAAMFMTLTYTAMRSEAMRHRSPGAALQAVNQRLMELNPTDMFVTMLYGILEPSKRQFSFARAGHTRPLVLDARHTPVALPAHTGQPVGLFEDVLLDEQSLSLPAGGSLLLFSDGLSETLEGLGVPCDLAELCSSLLAGPGITAQELCNGLWQTVTGGTDCTGSPISGHVPEQDDFTVLALRIS
jgi:phosphoserine phosphatase RsbU/P